MVMLLSPLPIWGDVREENETLLAQMIHAQKILLSDAILVVNIDGYVGEATSAEIKFAIRNSKKVHFLFQDNRRREYHEGFYIRKEINELRKGGEL